MDISTHTHALMACSCGPYTPTMDTACGSASRHFISKTDVNVTNLMCSCLSQLPRLLQSCQAPYPPTPAPLCHTCNPTFAQSKHETEICFPLYSCSTWISCEASHVPPGPISIDSPLTNSAALAGSMHSMS
jgi:hypothetical protein